MSWDNSSGTFRIQDSGPGALEFLRERVCNPLSLSLDKCISLLYYLHYIIEVTHQRLTYRLQLTLRPRNRQQIHYHPELAVGLRANINPGSIPNSVGLESFLACLTLWMICVAIGTNSQQRPGGGGAGSNRTPCACVRPTYISLPGLL